MATEVAAAPVVELWIEHPEPDAFAVFDAMRAAGIADVRKVGVALRHRRRTSSAHARPEPGAVVAVGDPRELVSAAPDAAVRPDESTPSSPPATPRRVAAPARPPQSGTGAHDRGREAGSGGRRPLPPRARVPGARPALRAKVREVAGVDPDWGVALLSGSGTLRTRPRSAPRSARSRKLVVVVNGVYGERLHEIARRAGIATVPVEGSWTEPIDAPASPPRSP